MDLPKFWNDKHHRQDRQWLTGSTLDMILKFYDLQQKDLQGRKVLEIGVGVGAITKSLSELASELYCADISSVALDKIKQYAKNTFLSQDIKQAPPADIVLCHLVLVHCDDREVSRILSDINLAPGGKIYCQFSCLKAEDSIDTASPVVKKQLNEAGPHFFRSPDRVANLIQQAGLGIVKDTECDPGAFLTWKGQFWKFYELERTQK